MLDSGIAATTDIGADTVDEAGVDAIDLGINDQSDVDSTTRSAQSTMPTDEQLRQWDSNSSGRSS
jgi:hypothetical protein